MSPSCYVVPAAEMQELLQLMTLLPFVVLLGYFICRAAVEWPEYVWEWRKHQRRRRIWRIRCIRQDARNGVRP